MENNKDKLIVDILKGTAILVAFAGVLAADFAGAADMEFEPYDYHELYGYEDEVESCVDILRPNIDAAFDERVEYIVEDIDLRGPWYKFELSAYVYAADGEKTLDGFNVACKSNRWITSARLIDRPNAESAERELLVSDTEQLAAWNRQQLHSKQLAAKAE